MGDAVEEVTRLLARIRQGEDEAREELFPLVYSELHSQAQRLMRNQAAGHTLQATALVHEAYVKLAGKDASDFDDRRHFLRVAAQAMRSVLVDHARMRGAAKRGGDRNREPLGEDAILVHGPSFELLALHEALERLEESEPRSAQVAELRMFGGLQHGEVASVLGISERTARREARFARAWLKQELDGQER